MTKESLMKLPKSDLCEMVLGLSKTLSENLGGTPASKWRKNGEEDPHGHHDHYNGERARLCKGYLTDDEMANAVYLQPSIGNLTAAKERIRWISRALIGSVDAHEETINTAINITKHSDCKHTQEMAEHIVNLLVKKPVTT